jgi:hypothetical protein
MDLARVARAAAIYFVVVLAAGFALGTVRTLVVVPRIGERAAELAEMPLLVAVSFLAARWIIARHAPLRVAQRFAVGLIALGLLLAAEVFLVLGARQLTLQQYITGRDPVAGSTYVIALALFALLPLVARPRAD